MVGSMRLFRFSFLFGNFRRELAVSIIDPLWYEVETWISDGPCQMKLIVTAANLIMWRFPRMVSGPYVTHFSHKGNDDVMHCLLLLRAITGRHFKFTPYIENEIAGKPLHSLRASMKYVCNQSSKHEALMNFNGFVIITNLFD